MTLTGLLLIGITIGTVLLLTQFEGALREGLTRKASQILKADVHLEAVRIDWSAQALDFKGVSVFNPEGFTDREAMRIESLQVRPQWTTVFSKTPVIREVALQGTRVHLQYKLGAATNLGAMMAHARHWTALQAEGERWVLGRPMTVAEIQSAPVALVHASMDPPVLEGTVTVEAFRVADPGNGEAVTGARVIHLVLKSLMKQFTLTNGLSDGLRELLIGESDLEGA